MSSKKGPDKNDAQLLDIIRGQGEALVERLVEVYALYNLSKNLNMSFQMDNIFDEIETLLKESLEIEEFSIFLLDEKGKSLSVWKANHSTLKTAGDVTFQMGEGITGTVAQEGEAILIQDVTEDSRFLAFKGRLGNIGSFYSIPLKLSDGRVLGVFNIHKKNKNGFREEDELIYKSVGSHIAQALENSQTFKEARKLAITDELTQLYSRRYFNDALLKEISKAQRHNDFFSIIMVDVDHFKLINDSFGHSQGDELLKKLGSLLKKTTRQGDVIARYGGEEFVILLPEIDKKEAISVAEKLREQVARELFLEGKDLPPQPVTISAGVALYGEDGDTAKAILDSADRRLYWAKNNGRNQVCGSIEPDGAEDLSEKRSHKRYHVGLKISRKPVYVQHIELFVSGRWMMCVVVNISKNGFRGTVDFDPRLGDKYKCKVRLKKPEDEQIIFDVSIKNRTTLDSGMADVGVQIISPIDQWTELYQMILH